MIYFATDAGGIVPDDKLAVDALAKLGIEVRPLVWGEKAENVVIRSCWDYHRNRPAFEDWVRSTKTWNRAETVLWNIDKKYLEEIASWGFAIPETLYLKAGSECSWSEFVAKPAVSLSGEDTFRNDRKRLSSLLKTRDMLVQEYVPEIQDGELSLIYLGGAYSHCVIKRPKRGEFRVQAEHGGRLEPYEPSRRQREEADRLLAKLGRLLYARVDMVPSRGRLMIMEVELIDPSLFLASAWGAPERFARAIADFIDSSHA